MLEAIGLAVGEVLMEGNGAKRFIPSPGGQWIRVSYLWGKLGLVFLDERGRLTLPARRGGGRAIAPPSETPVGEGEAEPSPPVLLALPQVNRPVGRDPNVDRD